MVNVCFFIMHNRCIINIGLSSNFQPVFVFIFTEHFLQVALLFVSYKTFLLIKVSSVQSRLTFCNPMNCSTTGFSVHHQLPELTQIHVHWVSDAIQPSHPLSSPSPPTQSIPASGSFQMRQFFTSGGQSIGVSASASVLPMNIQDWFPLELTGWTSLQSKGLSKSLFQHHSSKASIIWWSSFFMVQLSNPCVTTGKTIALTRWTFVGKVMSLLFNMLSRLVIAFLPRGKHLLISWLFK